jgi:hypothetical protein
VDTGVKIPESQFNKLNPNLKRTYLRKTFIGFEQTKNASLLTYEINYYSDEQKEKILKAEPRKITQITNPTVEMEMIVVGFAGFYIRDIKNPSEKAQRFALLNTGNAQNFFKYTRPDENVSLDELKRMAVEDSGQSLQYIKNPSEELQLMAVKKDGAAVAYVYEPSNEVQIEAVNDNPYSIRFIRNPSIEAQMLAVEKNPMNIQYISYPKDEVQVRAIKGNPEVYKYLPKPTDNAKKAYVELDYNNISKVHNPSDELQMMVVTHDPSLIKYISVPADEVQLYVVVNHPNVYTKFLKNRYESNNMHKNIPSKSVREYLDKNKPLNENINRIKELL